MNPPITPISPPVTIEGPLIPGLIPKTQNSQIQKISQFQKLQFFQFTIQLNSIEERWLPER